MRCDIIADGIVAAAREIDLKVPLVVRLEGRNVNEGKAILARSGLPIVAADGPRRRSKEGGRRSDAGSAGLSEAPAAAARCASSPGGHRW